MGRLDLKGTVRWIDQRYNGLVMGRGRYDMVAIWEVPDDQAAARLMLAFGSSGNLRSETLPAYPEEEYR